MRSEVWREFKRFGDVPTLVVCRGDAGAAAEKGCILVFHGLGAAKDVHLKELGSLAAQGFLAVGIDNVGHGERRHPDFDTRFAHDNPDVYQNFLQAVAETAAEVPSLVDALTESGFAQTKMGILGISMGGYITYKAVTLEPRLRAAVCLVASPEWSLNPSESPHRQLGRFDRVRLLSQTAGRDQVVPSRYARAFHEQLGDKYRDYDDRFTYAEYPDSDHMLANDWDRIWAETLSWFDKQLT